MATQERGVVITSSPLLMSRAAKAMWRAAVPLLTATPYLTPQYLANDSSNSSTFSPWLTQPLFIVSMTAWISSFPMSGLAKGIFTFYPQLKYC